MRSYRKTRGRPSQRKPSKTHGDERQKLLVELVENNVALDLKACGAKIWLICADDLAKNTFASAQVIVIKMIAREKKQSGL